MSTDTNLAVAAPQEAPALLILAGLTGLQKEYVIQTVKRQCFKDGNATDEQVDAFISICAELRVNPLLPGMCYAYPISGGGIVPIIGPSGIKKKLMEHPDVDSWETFVYPEDVTQAPTHATTLIYRKSTERPLKYTAVLAEWSITSNPNWKTRPRHMLELRSLKHCANQIIHGLPYDEDDRAIMAMQNVTGTGEQPENPKPERAAPRERTKRGAAAIVDVTPQADTAQNAVKPAVVAEIVVEAVPVVEAARALKVRTDLTDKEIITVNATIKEMVTKLIPISGVPTPSVQAVLTGGYEGEVYHIGGAEGSGQVITAKAPWKVGAECSFTLRGKLIPKAGKVFVYVDAIAASVEDMG